MKIPSGKFLLAASVHKPKKPNGILAVLLPGFLDTKDYQHLVLLGDALAKAGYTAVRFDPVGTWKSSGSEKYYSMTQYLRDVRSVLAWAKKRKLCPQDVVLIGHSMGGRIALLSAAKIPHVLAVVAIMTQITFSSPQTPRGKAIREKWIKSGFRASTRDIPGTRRFHTFRTPLRFLRDSEKYATSNTFGKLFMPKLFLAGTSDTIAPPKVVRSLHRLANSPKTFHLIQGIGHDYRHRKAQIAIVNRHILDFLATIVPKEQERRAQ